VDRESSLWDSVHSELSGDDSSDLELQVADQDVDEEYEAVPDEYAFFDHDFLQLELEDEELKAPPVPDVLNPASGRKDIPYNDDDGWKTETVRNPTPIYDGDEQGHHDQSLDDMNLSSDSSFDFWNLIMTDELINTIVSETNEYAYRWMNAKPDEIYDNLHPLPNKFRQPPKWLLQGWNETSYEEMLRFFAVLYIMSFVKLPTLRSYWSDRFDLFKVENVRQILSFNRFNQLKTCLHLVPWSDASDARDWKVRRFLNQFRRNCRMRWVCGLYCSFDEMMFRFSGHSTISFRKQPKPTPDGFKCLALADGKIPYLFDFDLDKREGTKLPHIMQIITKLEQRGRVVVIDRGYVTMDLINQIHSERLFLVGTVVVL
jgi:hypothetical protein